MEHYKSSNLSHKNIRRTIYHLVVKSDSYNGLHVKVGAPIAILPYHNADAFCCHIGLLVQQIRYTWATPCNVQRERGRGGSSFQMQVARESS
jgi:hypothetical protein